MRSKATKKKTDQNVGVVSSVSKRNINNNYGRSNFALPFGVLGGEMKRRRGRPPALKQNTTKPVGQNNAKGFVEKIRETGIGACPQCQLEFDDVNCSPIQEACGHIKCRACFIQSLTEGENYCHQCELEENPAVKLENTAEIERRVFETADLIRAAKSSKCAVQMKRIDIDLTPANKKESQMKLKIPNTFSSLAPSHPPVSLPNSTAVIEKASQSKRMVIARAQSSNTDNKTFGEDTEKESLDSNPSVKFVDNANQSLSKKVPKLLEVKIKSCQRISSSANVKDLKLKKKRKRNSFKIPDHIIVVQETPEDLVMYNCTHCSKKFKTKAHVKYHEFCGENALEKPYKCDQCGKRFVAKSHYEYHLSTHTGERPYVCPKCGKGFNQRGKVNRHMRSHTGERPFICQQCGRGFANTQALRSHFLIHTGERPFACQYCSKRFTGMTNLKKHVITHTGERPYSCSTCGKSFGLKWTLDLHARTHSTDRPFACNQCTRAFSNSKDLRRHLVIHTDERPWKCGICGTAFKRKDNLDCHKRNVHNFSFPKHVMSQIIHTNVDDNGEETTQKRNAEKTTPVTNQSEVLPRGSQEDTSTALVEDNEEEIVPHFENFESNDKLNLVPTSKCNESKDNIDEANNAYIKEKTVSFKALGSCQTKMEVIEAETTVEDLAREGSLPSSSNKNRLSPIVTAEDDLIQGIFIKQEQEPVHRNAEMASYVPSQGVTVVHEEDGSTHILL